MPKVAEALDDDVFANHEINVIGIEPHVSAKQMTERCQLTGDDFLDPRSGTSLVVSLTRSKE